MVLNPVAGRGKPEEVRQALENYFDDRQWELKIHETTADDLVDNIVRDALQQDGVEAVFAAGGDGTVSQVVDVLAGTEIPLGIIPLGTTNALAQTLEIPEEVDEACRLLAAQPRIVSIDALKARERYFVLNVGVGLGATTMEKTGREEKRRFGEAAYVWTAVKELAGIQRHRFTIRADGLTIFVRAADVLLANAGILTGPLRWGEHIRPDDGHVDICVVQARTVWNYTLLLWNILRHRQRRSGHIHYHVAREIVEIETDIPLAVAGDGEIIGHTPIKVEVVPAAVQVFVPA